MTGEDVLNRLSAELVIESHQTTPDELARAVGIEPDEAWRSGELRGPRSAVRYQTNGISYRCAARGPLTTDVLTPLQQRIAPVARRIRALKDELAKEESGARSLRLFITITTTTTDPTIGISADALRFWSGLGVALDTSVLVVQANSP